MVPDLRFLKVRYDREDAGVAQYQEYRSGKGGGKRSATLSL